MLKDSKDFLNINKWKALTHSCIRIINIVKITTLPKVIYRVNITPIKISDTIFADMKADPKIHMEMQKAQKTKQRKKERKKKNKVGGHTIPNFKTHCKATIKQCGTGKRIKIYISKLI